MPSQNSVAMAASTAEPSCSRIDLKTDCYCLFFRFKRKSCLPTEAHCCPLLTTAPLADFSVIDKITATQITATKMAKPPTPIRMRFQLKFMLKY